MRVGVEIENSLMMMISANSASWGGDRMMMMMMMYANYFCHKKKIAMNHTSFSSFFIRITDPIKHATIVRHQIGCKQASKCMH